VSSGIFSPIKAIVYVWWKAVKTTRLASAAPVRSVVGRVVKKAPPAVAAKRDERKSAALTLPASKPAAETPLQFMGWPDPDVIVHQHP